MEHVKHTPIAPDHSGKMRKGLIAGLAAILVVVLSGAWLVFPYFLDGKQMLLGVGDTIATQQRSNAATVSRLLTRVAE